MSWGYDCDGRLGNGGGTQVVPETIGGLNGVVQVSAGKYHSLFVKKDGTVWACGKNYVGQLGTGSDYSSAFPEQIPSLSDVKAVSAGGESSLFLKNNGTVWACGDNRAWELGDGTNIDKPVPVQITSLDNVIALAAGEDCSLFLKNDGTVWATGGGMGMGLGESFYSTVPVQITSLSGITAISVSINHSFFLKDDGTVYAAGNNDRGQLGDGTIETRYFPVKIEALSDIVQIDAGKDNQSFFLKRDSTVWVCGEFTHAYVEEVWDNLLIPKKIPALKGITSISVGDGFSLFQLGDNKVLGMGDNHSGMLGGPDPQAANSSTMTSGLCGEPSILEVTNKNIDLSGSIYPNPSPGETVYIKYPDNVTIERVDVCDLTGRSLNINVTSGPILSFETAGLNRGVYVVTVYTSKGKMCDRLVIE